MILNSDVEEVTKEKTKKTNSNSKVLVLHNDDYNTFIHVETCLISICKHSSQQAAQCAMIVHYRGKCDIKKGNEEFLKSLKRKLKQQGLIVTIEDL